MVSIEKPGTPAELNHHGIKGMRWGVRKSTDAGGKSGTPGRTRRVGRALGKAADNTLFEITSNSDHTQRVIANKASKKLKSDLPAIKARHGDYGKIRNRAKHPFSPEAKAYRKDVTTTYLKHLESSANEITNIRGTRQYTLTELGKPNTSRYFWNVHTQPIKHAASGIIVVHPIFDNEGYIVDTEVVNNDMAQAVDLVNNVLKHNGDEVIR